MRKLLLIVTFLFGMNGFSQMKEDSIPTKLLVENVEVLYVNNKINIKTINSEKVSVMVLNNKDKDEYTKFKVSNVFETTFEVTDIKNFTIVVEKRNKLHYIRL